MAQRCTVTTINDMVDSLVKSANEDKAEYHEKLSVLRQYVLKHNLPSNTSEEDLGEKGYSLRATVWKTLMGVGKIDVGEYESLVLKGPSREHLRIREDALRTFRHDSEFQTRVPEDKLVRVLSAFVHWSERTSFHYRGGMNCLCAPFLYVMSEPEAFFCFRTLISKYVPQYAKYDKAIDASGANLGCRILSNCLRHIEPDLFHYLERHGLADATLYAFPAVSTLGANVPPLAEILRLWDVQLGFGAHMNILFTLARLCISKDEIMASTKPMQVVNSLIGPRRYENGQENNAEIIIAKAIAIAKQLPEDFYWQLCEHTQHSISMPRIPV
ncbi:Putative mitotic check point protein BUB2 [Galdieria sulphuraria]|uniref:Cell cycle arrest protein BUB2 n=1 Tax=Galdieria sulphuraria TaxID=130081 RepID=M2WZ59_GALSU|nr:cell cycle arrest protein BUB2 [Galdieria sulphuraria]EME29345.1 cell cycle arrest protein BUB2 [Galdieria sulphuraria]GJD05817.1 Putative mitotic check point protein BUB2 [Galdieria sulphuraria]|eukprot:XP_005705865.1 cell cycle arrest protein BUB2 [Galdieria sulphuraria]